MWETWDRSLGFPGGTGSKYPPANAGRHNRQGYDQEDSGGHGNPLWYTSLENPMDRGAWWATVHGVTQNQT